MKNTLINKLFCSTIKTNLRSIVFWLVFTAGVMYSFIPAVVEEAKTPPHAFHNVLTGCAEGAITVIIPVLCSVVAGMDILRDRKNRCLDVCKCTGLKTRHYYIGKISAYMLLGFLAEIIYAYILLSVYLPKYNWLEGYAYTIPESVWLVFARVVILSLSTIPIYTALSVCIALSTRTPVFGIVFTIAFSNLKYFIEYRMSYFGYFIYPVPINITIFAVFFQNHAPEYMVMHIPVTDIVISYAWGFAIAAVLFAIGYFQLKKLTDR